MDTTTQVNDEIASSRTSTAEDTLVSPSSSADLELEDELLVEELRIDDLSIDGMCGVY